MPTKQWLAEGGGRTGRRPRASKTGRHPKNEVTKIAFAVTEML